MNLDEFIKSIPAMAWRMQTGARVALYKEGNTLLKDFEKRSPVDSGEYRRGWRMSKGNQGAIAVRIFNTDTEKGSWMEEGVGIGETPWYFTKSKKRKSGKLTIANNRVWAGGRKPGHSKTIGGAINPVIFRNGRRQLKLTRVVASGIIKGIK